MKDFLPHATCYLNDPYLIAVNLIADVSIAVAYFAISLVLFHLIKRRADLQFRGMALAFGIFIISCGGTHALEAWNVYRPDYWFAAALKSFTALVSVGTAVNLVMLVPKALRVPSVKILMSAHAELQGQIEERERAERTLRSILDSMAEGVIVVDQGHHLIESNAAAEAVYGLAFADPDRIWPGKLKLYRGPDDPYIIDELPIARALKGENVENQLVMVDQAKNGALWFSATARPISSQQGIQAAVCVIRDVTEERKSKEALAQVMQRYRSIFDSSTDGIAYASLQGRFLDVNPAFCKLTGYSFEELIDGLTYQDLTPVQYHQMEASKVSMLRAGKPSVTLSKEYIKKSGDRVPISLTVYLVSAVSGEPEALVAVVRDRTLELAEERARDLAAANMQLRALAETIPQIVWTAAPNGTIDYFNSRWLEATELSLESSLEQGWLQALPAEDAESAGAAWAKARMEERPFEWEHRLRDGRGLYRWHLTRALPFKNKFGKVVNWFGTSTDIDDQKSLAEVLEAKVAQRTSILQATLDEKTLLLREVHHRVKNNLQVVTGLLHLQARTLEDPDIAGKFRECELRVNAMALVHDQLYGSSNLDSIDLAVYIHRLVQQLELLYASDDKPLTMDLKLASVHLGIEQAVPCGLLLNELITNSFKHAFPKVDKGLLSVTLEKIDATITLKVSDNGPGVDSNKVGTGMGRKTLGLRLVKTLASQLQGTFQEEHGAGYSFLLSFPAK